MDGEFATGVKRAKENEGKPEEMEKRDLRAVRWRIAFHCFFVESA
jgi:hypothetical protein